MKSPSISIIIPTYNHCHDLLKPCLESIIRYTDLSNTEVIVVANGCKDNTREYVNSLGKPFQIIWFDDPIGYTIATNEGIKKSSGEYLILLNNDVVLLGQDKNLWIEMLMQPFLDNPRVGLSGPTKDWGNSRRFLIFFCTMIHRRVFDKIGLLDETFSPGAGEDTDFCIKAENANFKIVQVPNEEQLERPVQEFYATTFPIYHKGEGTVNGMTGWNTIFERNRKILEQRYGYDGLKVKIGMPEVNVPDFLSLGTHPDAILKCDPIKIDFEQSSISQILVLHLFEHISPYESLTVLKNWFRLLRPGGKLIIETPDMENLCSEFLFSDKTKKYEVLNCMYGLLDGYVGETVPRLHSYAWCPETLEDHLYYSGFIDVKVSAAEIHHRSPSFRIIGRKKGVDE
jgi:glycosyltransferase involved in cell wall biosynthesis